MKCVYGHLQLIPVCIYIFKNVNAHIYIKEKEIKATKVPSKEKKTRNKAQEWTGTATTGRPSFGTILSKLYRAIHAPTGLVTPFMNESNVMSVDVN